MSERMLTDEDFTALKELFESIHGHTLEHIRETDSMFGYYSQVSPICQIFFRRRILSSSYRLTPQTLATRLRDYYDLLPGCSDNSAIALQEVCGVLLSDEDLLPLEASRRETNVEGIWYSTEEIYPGVKTMVAIEKTSGGGIVPQTDVPDSAVIAMWRLARGL